MEERPTLQIEQPPAWYIEKIEKEKKKKDKKKEVVIDLVNDNLEDDRDENGFIVIKM
jgi:hypothetical protein